MGCRRTMEFWKASEPFNVTDFVTISAELHGQLHDAQMSCGLQHKSSQHNTTDILRRFRSHAGIRVKIWLLCLRQQIDWFVRVWCTNRRLKANLDAWRGHMQRVHFNLHYNYSIYILTQKFYGVCCCNLFNAPGKLGFSLLWAQPNGVISELFPFQVR